MWGPYFEVKVQGPISGGSPGLQNGYQTFLRSPRSKHTKSVEITKSPRIAHGTSDMAVCPRTIVLHIVFKSADFTANYNSKRFSAG